MKWSNKNRKPSITFNDDGLIVIRGRAINVESEIDFLSVMDWSKCINKRTITCSLMLDYINASSLRQITQLFINLESNEHVRDIYVVWYIDKEDSSILETIIILNDLFPSFNFSIQKIDLLELNEKMLLSRLNREII